MNVTYFKHKTSKKQQSTVFVFCLTYVITQYITSHIRESDIIFNKSESFKNKFWFKKNKKK